MVAQEGNSLLLTAKYFSPTKELIEDTLSLITAYSPLTLSLQPSSKGSTPSHPHPTPSLGVILPGFPFSLFASVQDSTGASVSSKSVEARLYAWDGVAPPLDRTTGKVTMTGTALQVHPSFPPSLLMPPLDLLLYRRLIPSLCHHPPRHG